MVVLVVVLVVVVMLIMCRWNESRVGVMFSESAHKGDEGFR